MGERTGRETSLIGVVQALLGAAAVVAAAIYVLLNALYVEYFNDFGLRPEDVGVDRLAVLGRAAWVALVLLMLTSLILVVVSAVYMRGYRQTEPLENAGNVDEVTKALKEREEKRRRSLLLGVVTYGTGLIISLLVGSFFIAERKVEDLADDAKKGYQVGGIGPIVEVVDIRAVPAAITWTGEKGTIPRGFDPAKTHLYLGRGNDVVAVLSCNGSTFMLRPDDVIVTILKYDDEVKNADRTSICPSPTPTGTGSAPPPTRSTPPPTRSTPPPPTRSTPPPPTRSKSPPTACCSKPGK